ncbi:MAG: chromosome segregation protein SMC, partial [Proteobacteria bacterium]|nr:chromosome segregation protein SMC [Pseudomonadota bacterium]
YKERRRETETRMQHTQENLSRLNDINEELTKQLRHLKRQAESAEKYTELKQRERIIEAEIKALQWLDLQQQIGRQEEPLNQCQRIQDEQLTSLRATEQQMEQSHLQNIELTSNRDTLQKQFYHLGAEVSSLEHQIQNLQQQMQRWRKELTQADVTYEELEQHHQHQLQLVDNLAHEQAELIPQVQAAKTSAEAIAETEHAAVQRMAQWQRQWDGFQTESAKFSAEMSVLQANKQHYSQQLKTLEIRHAQLLERLNQTPVHSLAAEIEPLTEQVAFKRQELQNLQDQLDQVTESIRSLRQTISEQKQKVTAKIQQLQQLQGQFASLEAVQRSALGYQDNHTKDWLNQHTIASRPRLGQMLQVAKGWEKALETVLGENIEAVCVDQFDSLIAATEKITQGRLTLLRTAQYKNDSLKANEGLVSLASLVSSEWPVSDWLATVYVAENLVAALQMQPKLAPHESIITQQGIWLGCNWVRIIKKTGKESGILVREQELKSLHQTIENEKQAANLLQMEVTANEETLKLLEEQRDLRHQQYQKTSAALTEIQAKLSGFQSRYQELRNQQERLNKEIKESEQSIQNLTGLIEKNLMQLNQLTDSEQILNNKQQQLTDERDLYRQDLDSVRQKADHLRRQADELSMRLSNVSHQLTLQQQNSIRETRQRQQLIERREQLNQELVANEQPLEALQTQLQLQLVQRQQIEASLRDAEQALSASQQQLEELKKSQQRTEQKLAAAKNQWQQLQLERQALVVRQTTIQEQLQTLNWQLEQVTAGLPVNADLTDWEQQLAQITAKIQRLGAINLAAIAEYQTVNERKTFLDKQQSDLDQALTILQSAIAKIDRETRSKFQETFEQVNHHFQELFPRIFNGGKAYLELIEEDALTAGVVVKAQPPGKRNATIYMLSGGEKALTAVALVFAMYRLNPAPFCVLDEVDAPLDDINTGRFCQLVKEMAKTTQFIVISHNKVTISMSEHLMGVTMQEAGVSRIVSVNVAEAVALAEV